MRVDELRERLKGVPDHYEVLIEPNGGREAIPVDAAYVECAVVADTQMQAFLISPDPGSVVVADPEDAFP